MISNKFSVTRLDDRPLSWWYMQRGSIDFEPDYQRKNNIWSLTDKAFLIDSIVNDFDVPKLYLADLRFSSSQLNRGDFDFAVIDGKQRLEAIFDFFNGDLRLNKNFVYRHDPEAQLGGLRFDDLWKVHPDVANKFEERVLDFMLVSAEDEKDISEMFVRLNRSKPLVGAEIRNAGLGPVNELIRATAEHEFFEEYIAFSTKRAGDRNAAAKILFFEYRGFPSSTKKKDLDAFAESTEVDQDRLELAAFHSDATLKAMSQTFLPRDELLRSAGQLPVYYWLIRILPDHAQEYLREFLSDFEEKRDASRKAQAAGDRSSVDEELARYDVLNRSTNDKGSHVARIAILADRFGKWVSKFDAQLERDVKRELQLFRDATNEDAQKNRRSASNL